MKNLTENEIVQVGMGQMTLPSFQGWTFYFEGNSSIVGVGPSGSSLSILLDDNLHYEFQFNGQTITGYAQEDEWGQIQSMYFEGEGSVFFNWDFEFDDGHSH